VQRVCQSDGQSVSLSVGRLVSRSGSQWVKRLVSQSVSRSVSKSVGQSVGQSAGQSVSQSVSQLLSQSIGRSVGQSVSILFRLQQTSHAVPTVLLSCSLPDCPTLDMQAPMHRLCVLVEGVVGKGERLNSLAVAKLGEVQ